MQKVGHTLRAQKADMEAARMQKALRAPRVKKGRRVAVEKHVRPHTWPAVKNTPAVYGCIVSAWVQLAGADTGIRLCQILRPRGSRAGVIAVARHGGLGVQLGYRMASKWKMSDNSGWRGTKVVPGRINVAGVPPRTGNGACTSGDGLWGAGDNLEYDDSSSSGGEFIEGGEDIPSGYCPKIMSGVVGPWGGVLGFGILRRGHALGRWI
ncbi:hypothetical protein B0H12DRAFT_1077123 [Mycena haematopus]|nr:hypothetical protein B0H12DRAFT_1077123 [Mycena haematopus]